MTSGDGYSSEPVEGRFKSVFAVALTLTEPRYLRQSNTDRGNYAEVAALPWFGLGAEVVSPPPILICFSDG